MKVIGKGQNYKLIVEMDESDWSTLQSMGGIHYNAISKEPGASVSMKEIDAMVDDIRELKKVKGEITGMMGKWKKLSDVLSKALGMEPPQKGEAKS